VSRLTVLYAEPLPAVLPRGDDRADLAASGGGPKPPREDMPAG
jgi:hypothetical protein